MLSSKSEFLYYYLSEGHLRAASLIGDTIACGNWSFDTPGWLVVSSPSYLLDILKIKVEENSNNNRDTVYVKINNPFETDKANHFLQKTNAIYALSVSVLNGYLEQIDLGSTSSVIKLYNPKKLRVLSISLVVHAEPDHFDDNIFGNYNEGFKAGETKVYEVKNHSSNQFVVNIPDLTMGFLNQRRLNQDYIKVIDKDHLKWEGRIFKKENNSTVKM